MIVAPLGSGSAGNSTWFASDGTSIRVYKNGRKIGEQPISLADDEPVVNVMPVDEVAGPAAFPSGHGPYPVTKEQKEALLGLIGCMGPSTSRRCSRISLGVGPKKK